MTEDIRNQLSGFLGGLRRKAADTIARQQTSLARGKVAGTTVSDESGSVIVEAGHVIDEAALERAAAAGKLGALAAAAITAQTQDLKERARDAYARTQEGQEAQALDSVEDFVRARRYIGRFAGVDVTDIRGNVIVPKGKEIDEADVRLARDVGQLSALIYAAQQPIPESEKHAPPELPKPPTAKQTLPVMTKSAPERHAPLPVLPIPESPANADGTETPEG